MNLSIEHSAYTLLLRHNRQMTSVHLADLRRNPVTLEVGGENGPGTVAIRVGAGAGVPGPPAWLFTREPDAAHPQAYRADEGLIRLVREVFGPLAVLTLPERIRDQAVLLTGDGGSPMVLDPRELFMFGQTVALASDRHGQTTVKVSGGGGQTQVALTFEDGLGLAPRPGLYRTDAGAQLLFKRLLALKATDLRAAPALQ